MHFTAFFRNGKNQGASLEKGIMRKQAQAEQWQEQNHHLHHQKLNLMQEEQGCSET